eukprot:3987894-Alexandrium_andersonii.AAC.1
MARFATLATELARGSNRHSGDPGEPPRLAPRTTLSWGEEVPTRAGSGSTRGGRRASQGRECSRRLRAVPRPRERDRCCADAV